ncbi:ATP-binding cassette domain-containing protein [Aeromicrobium sp. UC242_57]|uniref:ATP-binding cassette domain-containing protein n=1 Tax=Aeromicrobium sp. UC242_57 TaxID=3374624 RepID=UPI0037B9B107
MPITPDESRDGPPSSGAHLLVEGVTVRFGGLTALSDVGFEAPEGQILGVIGPNGAGKTTLFNVICGFTRSTGGRMSLDGAPYRPRPHLLTRMGVSRSLQGLGLFPGLSVLENITAGAGHLSRSGFLSGLLALPRSRKERAEPARPSDRVDRRARARCLCLRPTGDLALRHQQAGRPRPHPGQRTTARPARRTGGRSRP